MSEYLLTDYTSDKTDQLERNYLHQTPLNQGRHGPKTELLTILLLSGLWTGQEQKHIKNQSNWACCNNFYPQGMT